MLAALDLDELHIEVKAIQHTEILPPKKKKERKEKEENLFIK
jgi:hypothetical protein